MLSVCVDDALRRSGVVHRSGGEAVAGFGGPFDASVSNELLEGGADGRVSRRGALADLSLRERLVGIGEDLDDTLLSGARCRHGFVRPLPAKPQGGPLTVADCQPNRNWIPLCLVISHYLKLKEAANVLGVNGFELRHGE